MNSSPTKIKSKPMHRTESSPQTIPRTDSSPKEQVHKQFTVKSEAIGKLSAVNLSAFYCLL
jgi:hypothetical protein